MLDPPTTAPSFAIVRAPSGLGLRATGVQGLADALFGHGLAQALAARLAATVAPPTGSGVRDPASGVLNGPEVAAYAVALADAVGEVLDAGDVPLVLGGDCSVLLGAALLLEGAAGIGKTTLWQAGIASAQAKGYRVLACSPSEALLGRRASPGKRS